MALIKPYATFVPQIAASAWLAETAVVVGNVFIGEDANIWYGAVLRGDVGSIRIGARTNIQDGAILHMTTDVSNTVVGNEVTVGHAAVLHGVTIGDGALIGMGAVLLDNAEVGEDALVAAGSLVPARMRVPPRTLVRGQPARVVRELSAEECRGGRQSALHYVELARDHARAEPLLGR